MQACSHAILFLLILAFVFYSFNHKIHDCMLCGCEDISSCWSGPALSLGGPPKTRAPGGSIWVETSARPSRVLTNLTHIIHPKPVETFFVNLPDDFLSTQNVCGGEVEIDVATMLCPSLKWSLTEGYVHNLWELIWYTKFDAVMNKCHCWHDRNGGIFDKVERFCMVNFFFKSLLRHPRCIEPSLRRVINEK
jgi:hypothetical protein